MNVRKRSLSFNDHMNNDSEESKLSTFSEREGRADLAADWFELRLILKEIPRNDSTWENLSNVGGKQG